MEALESKLLKTKLTKTEAEELSSKANQIIKANSPEHSWSLISRTLLNANMPFIVHQILYDYVYADVKENVPRPTWIPSLEEKKKTRAYDFWTSIGLNSYEELHSWSCHNRLDFWAEVTKKLDIVFSKKFDQIAEKENLENPNWFKGARMNIADSCFRESNKNNVAITYKAEGGQVQQWTFQELNVYSNQVANGLIALGLRKGDRIAIDMVMTAESIAIYLGVIKVGGVIVSIPDSLAPAEVQKRLLISETKLLFTQDVLLRAGKELPLYEKILEANPKMVVVLPIQEPSSLVLREQDMYWSRFLSDKNKFDTVQCSPMDHINILFSSGTTGEPKAIPWNHSTPVKSAADGLFHHDIHKGDVVAWPTNLGWMMGPWLIFASLLNEASIALFYGIPTGREFGEFVQEAKVNMLGVVPSIVKQWKESNCLKGLDWSCIKNFSSTGESSNAEDMFWLMAIADYKPIIEYCGGTEIGGGYICGSMVQAAAPAHFTTQAIGLNLRILDEDGEPTVQGEVFIEGPSIGLSVELLNQDHHKLYYEETPLYGGKPLRRHGDEIEIVPNGFFRAHGRVDDTMNLGGIKVSSIEIERTLNMMVGVLETAAIAVNLSQGGPNALVVYVVLEVKESHDADSLRKEFQNLIKSKLNPLFKIMNVCIIEELPRTPSNKIMRRVLRNKYSKELI